MSAVEDKKLQGILRCPTMARILAAFNRDLALLTHTVWMDNRIAILMELKYMMDRILPEETLGRRNDKVRCSYCPRLNKAKGMSDHVVDKHKDQNPDAIPFIPVRNEKHCANCPDSKRVFTKRGLADHKLHRHSKQS
ncbi:hypothetical protein MVEN_02208900 [Mycena venus]|uniref:Uncharacterized protein n=1 Tax=Mycena venus TaxID=2733690 RepID=A0A8H6X6Q2_9AGAR|nr:hypothetical protein MVEN_02208900 [Mycena venus]